MSFTPSLKFEAAFGQVPLSERFDWTDLTQYNISDVRIRRGRPTELDAYIPSNLSLKLVNADRNLDPTNLSGTHVAAVDTSRFPVASTAALSTEVGTSLGTDNAISLPSGVSVGDLLIAFVAVDNPGVTDTTTGTGSATWTTLSNTLVSGSAVRHTIFARIATGSDALVLTGASQDYCVGVVRVIRHGCSTVGDVLVATAASATTGSIDPPSLATGSTKRYLWLTSCAVDLDSIEFRIRSVPASFSELLLTESSTVADSIGLGIGWKHSEVATLDPDTFDVGYSLLDWVAQTLAIPPAASSETVSLLTPNTPVRLVAEMDRSEVLLDTCAGPKLHSGWSLQSGALKAAIAGSITVETVEMHGPVFNWNGDSRFTFGIADDGSSPDVSVTIYGSNGGDFGFTVQGSTLRWLVNDGTTQADDVAVWNDTNHRYLRVSISGNDVVFERSADNSSWTSLDTFTRGTDFSSDFDWSAGKVVLLSQGGEVEFDYFRMEVSQFTRFTGTVDSWEFVGYPGNQGASVYIEATDNLKLLNNIALESPYVAAVKALEPQAWYRLDESRGAAVAVDSSGNGYDGFIGNNVEMGTPPAVTSIGGSGARFPSLVQKPGIKLPDSARRTSVPYSINLWINGLDPLSDDGSLGSPWTAAQIIYTQGEVDGDDWLVAIGIKSVTKDSNDRITSWGVSVYAYEPSAPGPSGGLWTFDNDGLPHMITLVVDALSSYTIYVDGVEADNISYYTLGFVGAFVGHYIGRGTVPPGVSGGYGFPGIIDDVSLYNKALSSSEISDLYLAATEPWVKDGTGQRVNRILDLVGWPNHLRSIDSGTTALRAASVVGEYVYAELQRVSASEGGRLYMGTHGELVFHDKYRVSQRTNNSLTFDDAGAGVNILAEGFGLTIDDRRLYTAAVINNQTYTDSVSVARYGRRDFLDSTMQFYSDRFAYNRAAAIVSRYKEPLVRIGSFSVAPEKDQNYLIDLLSIRLGDSMRVTFTILGTGDTFDGYVICDHFVESFIDGAWQMVFEGSSEDPYYGKRFKWNAADSDGVGWNMGKWL